MSALQIYTIFHVIISLVAIVTGIIATYGLIKSQRYEQLTIVFLVTTLLTSLTGFPFFLFPDFPIKFGPTPGVAFAVLSFILLAAAVYARYIANLAGRWRAVYVNTSIFALYLNVVVLIVQTFGKTPALQTLSSKQIQFWMGTVQLICLLAFAYAGFNATTKFERTDK